MSSEEPPFLPVGTAVSAKYRGAFCEAQVKKIIRNVKCKVTLKDTGQYLVVLDEELQGNVKTGHLVDVKHPDTGQFVPCIINKITDQSTYTVVFDDGDENTLRRTQLCLKGEKHFVKSDTLDDLPLTNPEHFGTPVMRGSRKMNRKRMTQNESSSESESEESGEDEGAPESHMTGKNLIGQVVMIEVEDRKKTMWVPALVVQPSTDRSELRSSSHILVKSFKDTKLIGIPRKDAKEFSRESAMKNDDKTLKLAYERALQYYDSNELPSSWDRDELLGSESEHDNESSDEEPSEEKDRFVAQLYKFMDDRGTPMNKAPQVANRDLNLYKLFQLVQDLGGYNKVTNQMRWHVINSKMSLPSTSSASSQIKQAYKKYLHAFEDFDRKLGCTMGTITRPRSRHIPGRNLISFRERESTPKSPRRTKLGKNDDDDEVRSNRDVSDRSDAESIKSEFRSRSRLDAESSDSETDGSDNRPVTREGNRPLTREDLSKAKPQADDSKRKKDLPVKAEPDIEKDKEEKPLVEKEDKEEIKQPKKRGRKKESEQAVDVKDDKKLKRKSKDRTISEQSESKTNSDEEEETRARHDKATRIDYDINARLKIKYGKAKSQKIYEAKLIETRVENGCKQYKVHYAGWNNRYDEWIKKDRIVGPFDEANDKTKMPPGPPDKPPCPPGKPPGPPGRPPGSTVKTPKQAKPLAQVNKPVAGTSSNATDSVSKITATPSKPTSTATLSKPTSTATKPPTTPAPKLKAATGKKLMRRALSATPAKEKDVTVPTATPGSSTKAQRPTRSTSVESHLAAGLPVKRRMRKNSGMGDTETSSTHVSDSDSEMSDPESEGDIRDRVTRSHAESEGDIRDRVTRSRKEADVKPEPETPTAAPEVQAPPAEAATTAEVKAKEEKLEESPDKEIASKPTATVCVKTADEPKEKEAVVERPVEATFPSTSREPAQAESTAEKKPDDKIYDFEDSSSQDSAGAVKPVIMETKEVLDRSRYRRKEGLLRTRAASTDSATSNDSLGKALVKADDAMSAAKVLKDTRVNIKADVELKTEPEKKKPGPKPKEITQCKDSDNSKPKNSTKADKPKGKRKLESPVPDDLDKKKVRRVKDEGKGEASKKPADNKVVDAGAVIKVDDPSLSPNYIPAPTLTQNVSIETDREVNDDPAPQLSPIANVSSPTPAVVAQAPDMDEPASSQPSMASTAAVVMPIVDAKAIMLENTPPDTPEARSPAVTDNQGEPTPADSQVALPNPELCDVKDAIVPPSGGESPNTCNTSVASTSSGGSSGNAPGSESEEVTNNLKGSAEKAKSDDDDENDANDKAASSRKRRKRQIKCQNKKVSDSDESESIKSPGSSRAASVIATVQRQSRPPRYNFLDMRDAQYLEGEDRIVYLETKLNDIRKLYLQLKGEVACIDRRRKRQRRKMHEAAAKAAVAAVVDRGNLEMS